MSKDQTKIEPGLFYNKSHSSTKYAFLLFLTDDVQFHLACWSWRCSTLSTNLFLVYHLITRIISLSFQKLLAFFLLLSYYIYLLYKYQRCQRNFSIVKISSTFSFLQMRQLWGLFRPLWTLPFLMFVCLLSFFFIVFSFFSM